MNCHYFKNQTSNRPLYFNSRRVPFNEAQALIKKILPDAGFTSAYETISKWPGYQPTSLINLDNVADALGVKSVFYKNEAERFGLKSFKALGGAYAVHKCCLLYTSPSPRD